MIEAHAVPLLSDNYAWLLRCPATGTTAIVDPAETAPIIAAVDAAGGRLDLILLTHHHGDHVAAADQIRAHYGAPITGAAADRHRLPRLDREVREGAVIELGEARGEVWETPGHTIGHISFVFPGVLICADTLFSLGCGRLLEGTPAQMFASLRRCAALPPETLVCCGHEYTASNARFALHADPENAALRAYAEGVTTRRAAGQATVPSLLSDELACNPFLRAPDVSTLADLRARKDHF